MASNDTRRSAWANDREPGAKGNEHTIDWVLDHPGAGQPFGSGPLPDYVTELEPGVYLLEMPGAGPEAQIEAGQ
jgi:hypothetical protein